MNWITKQDIFEKLKQLNLRNEVILVYGDIPHQIPLIGGPQSFIEALLEAGGPKSTIIMPAHPLSSRPYFFDPHLPETLRDFMPAFDVNMTPPDSGSLAQALALNKSTARSNHPLASFLALGYKANWIVKGHEGQTMFGMGSPLEKAYGQRAKLLCINMNPKTLTALHLMGYMAGKHDKNIYEACVWKGGKKQFVTFEDLKLDGASYEEIVTTYQNSYDVSHIEIGGLSVNLFDYQEIIDFGTESMIA